VGRFDYLIQKQRREACLRRLAAQYEPLAPSDVIAEWRPAPLGRLGRMLWADIERYLEFVEIARSSTPGQRIDAAVKQTR
jgi:hypothetical protein